MPIKDPSKKTKYQKEYVARHRERINEYCRNKRKANPEKTKAKDLQYRKAYQAKAPVRTMLRTARDRAAKRNIEFSISEQDLVFPSICPVLGVVLEFSYTGKQGGSPNSPSIDRIDNTLGYIPGNVQIISHLANSMKSTATKEQLLAFAAWVYSTYV